MISSTINQSNQSICQLFLTLVKGQPMPHVLQHLFSNITRSVSYQFKNHFINQFLNQFRNQITKKRHSFIGPLHGMSCQNGENRGVNFLVPIFSGQGMTFFI